MGSYSISSVDDWNYVANNIQSIFSVGTEQNVISIDSDLDFSTTELIPLNFDIGIQYNDFIFEGNNHTISNVKIPFTLDNVTTSAHLIICDNYYSSDNFTFKNMNFKNINLEASSKVGIVRSNHGNKTFINCHSHGRMTSSPVPGYSSTVSGLLCSTPSNSSYPSLTLLNCSVNVDLTLQGSSTRSNCGGMSAGKVSIGDFSCLNSHVYGTATISGTTDYYGFCDSYYTDHWVKFCTNSMNVYATGTNIIYGITNAYAIDCYTLGNFIGGNSTTICAIAGIIRNSYCRGNLKGSRVYALASSGCKNSLSLSSTIEGSDGILRQATTTDVGVYYLDSQSIIGTLSPDYVGNPISLSQATSRDFYKNTLGWNI